MRDEPCERPAEPWFIPPARIPLHRPSMLIRWAASEAREARQWQAHEAFLRTVGADPKYISDAVALGGEAWVSAVGYLLDAVNDTSDRDLFEVYK